MKEAILVPQSVRGHQTRGFGLGRGGHTTHTCWASATVLAPFLLIVYLGCLAKTPVSVGRAIFVSGLALTTEHTASNPGRIKFNPLSLKFVNDMDEFATYFLLIL